MLSYTFFRLRFFVPSFCGLLQPSYYNVLLDVAYSHCYEVLLNCIDVMSLGFVLRAECFGGTARSVSLVKMGDLGINIDDIGTATFFLAGAASVIVITAVVLISTRVSFCMRLFGHERFPFLQFTVI